MYSTPVRFPDGVFIVFLALIEINEKTDVEYV